MNMQQATPSTRSVGELFEQLPFTGEHLKVGLLLFTTFVIEAWVLMAIVYCGDSIRREFAIDTVKLGHLISAIFIGMGLGSLFWGKISNRIGRKQTLIWSLGLYGVISMASAFAPDYASLYALRLVAGMAAVGIMVVIIVYFVELLPVRLRGPATVILSAGWPVGMLVAIALSHLLTDQGWRWMIAVSSFAGIWALVIWCHMPESPYWLAGVNRQSQARAVLRQLSGGQLIVPDTQTLNVDAVKNAGILDVLRGPYLRITVIQFSINFLFSWGYWGLQTWLPTLLQERGLSLPGSYGFIALSAACMIPGYLSAGWATQRFGRKPVMVAYVSLAAISGLVFALSHHLLLLYLSNFAMSFFNQGAWGVWNTWKSELYDTRTRTPGYSLAVLAQRITNIIAPIVIGMLVAAGAGFVVIIGFIDLFIALTVILALMLPETEGRRIE